SDLFSLGVCLYEATTGVKPFAGDNVTTIIYKIVNEEPVPAREVDVSVHPGLSAVIQKTLAKTVAHRYQSGADLAHDLLNYKTYSAGSDSQTVKLTTGAPKPPAPPPGNAPAMAQAIA